MFLTSAEQGALRRCFALLAEGGDQREIREQLGQVLLDLFHADHFASYVWQPDRGRFEDRVSLNMDAGNLHSYEAWYQHRDPITFLLQSCRHATLVSEVMPRREFVRTEFFNDFIARDGLHWGMNLHAFEGDVALGDLRIWRGRQRRDFEDRDKMLLDLIEPAFVAALRRARQAAGAVSLAGLSPRELEVAACVGRGMTNKEIARALRIGVPSVATYLNRIFEKTGVHRRAALARLADSLH